MCVFAVANVMMETGLKSPGSNRKTLMFMLVFRLMPNRAIGPGFTVVTLDYS